MTDSANQSVDQIRQDQVQVLENGVPQTISLFEKDERPIDYALVLDNSGSFLPVLESALTAAREIVNNSRPTDDTFIERFISSDKIETVQEFTSEKTKLIKALDSLYVEKGQSAVVDALYLAVQHVSEHRANENRRKAVVVFTDCEERASYYSTDQLIKLIRNHDVQVFVVGVVELLSKDRGLITNSPRERAERLGKRIAEESGGRFFFPRNAAELMATAGQIVHDLRLQYIVGYEPIKPGKGFRKVKVSIIGPAGEQRLTAVTRSGYLAEEPMASDRPKKVP